MRKPIAILVSGAIVPLYKYFARFQNVCALQKIGLKISERDVGLNGLFGLRRLIQRVE
jgi:hypothetical protein